MARGISLVTLLLNPTVASAQSRTNDNAITQADDVFGYSVGRESIGIYDAGNARGFSPTAAGNLRIDGLYFAPVVQLSSSLIESEAIKVGISAQGYPFAAPSGIVDQQLRRPADKLGGSIIVSGDSFGSAGLEADGSIPLLSTLSTGFGVTAGRTHFSDGTSNRYHSETMLARWQPALSIEIRPFWSAFTDIDDLSSPTYVPAGPFIPPEPLSGHYVGPSWNGINRTQTNYGLLASATLARTWSLRVGAFRSLQHLRTGYTYLVTQLQPDGTGQFTIYANPPSRSAGLSGEVRLTHDISEGPRVHRINFSVRSRQTGRTYGGDAAADLGVRSIYHDFDTPRPVFAFGAQSRDRVDQQLYGVAYDGRWAGVGELSFGGSKTAYRKSTIAPPLRLDSRASPFLYNGSLTLYPFAGTAIYGGYSRGFEENGFPPPNAANRTESLPAIITRQIEAGARIQLTTTLRAVAGVFDLRRPDFGFDSANRYVAIGTTRDRGVEFSLSGNVTHQLTVVAGGVLLDARVAAANEPLIDRRRPVGIPAHFLTANLNWVTPLAQGLSVDASLSERGRTFATTDNQVELPARTQLNLGARYSFPLRKGRATARFQLANVLAARGFTVAGPGAYSPNSGRSASAYLTMDL